MNVGVLDLLRVGVGPSSSHTVAPMEAARRFAAELSALERHPSAAGGVWDRITITCHGSLGATGVGHGTDRALVLGLTGCDPTTVHPEDAWAALASGLDRGVLDVAGASVPFSVRDDVRFTAALGATGHPNEMTFEAWHGTRPVHTASWLSVGGGFLERVGAEDPAPPRPAPPHPFRSGADLLAACSELDLSVAALARRNEEFWHGAEGLSAGLATVLDTMDGCLDAGLAGQGTLPGGLGVRRRAAGLLETLSSAQARGEHIEAVEWLSVWALAVSEQNAAGARVVTAPTNGAAGVIPATVRYAREVLGAGRQQQSDFLLAAGAIGAVLKQTSALSGAQLGCQGEIGSAAAMAAAGLATVLGGTPQQVLNAAEIALEHHLGLTCDPVAGLVQVPCIERNAVGAAKALQSARLATRSSEPQRVSLDQAIAAMNEIGADMSSKYRETAAGGLALSVTVC